MPAFKGFSSKTKKNIQLPPEFFSEVLPQISNTDELRLVLCVFWYLQKRDENTGYVSLEELTQEPVIIQMFSRDGKLSVSMLDSAVDKAVKDGILLRGEREGASYLFINSPRGDALHKGLETGEWIPGTGGTAALPVSETRPNIFTLYEQNIGLLTPLMAETLADAEKNYPADWIEEAVKIAVERNARNWRFVEAILRSWKEKGRNEKDQRTPAEGRKRDSEGEFSDFIRH